MFDDSIVFKNKLIMVMGLQRSGTSALTEAIGQDPALRVETESPNNAFYDNYFLRPEKEIRGLLWRIKRRVLLKPISEIQRRSVEDVLREFEDYGVKLVWIYRDPVNVWSSMVKTFNVPDDEFHRWIVLWNEGNQSALEAKRGPYGSQLAFVRYEDLISQRVMFTELCRFLGVEERNNLFWQADEKKGRRGLDPELQRTIEAKTGVVLAELNSHRIRPRRVDEVHDDGKVDARFDLSRVAWVAVNHDDAFGSVLTPVHCPTRMRIETARKGTCSEAIQIVQSPIAVRKGALYTLFFWARADRPRTIGCAVSQNYGPWLPLAEYHTIDLTPQWQPIRKDFVVTADEYSARVYLDVGDDDALVEISEPEICAGIRPLFRLECHNGADAVYRYDPETPGAQRIEIARPGGARGDVQLVCRRLAAEKGEPFLFSFSARSDRERSIAFCFGQIHAPWSSLGIYQIVHLSGEWQEFHFEFTSNSTEEARLFFDLGGEAGDVELRGVDLIKPRVRLDQLRVDGGSDARIVHPPNSEVVRVEILHNATKEPTDIQISLGEGRFVAGRRYAVAFRGRADRPRRFGFGVSMAHEPWENLGFYQKLELTQEWRQFYYEFIASKNDDRVRVAFDLGGSDASAEFCEVQLTEGTTPITDDDLMKLQKVLEILEATRGAASPV